METCRRLPVDTISSGKAVAYEFTRKAFAFAGLNKGLNTLVIRPATRVGMRGVDSEGFASECILGK